MNTTRLVGILGTSLRRCFIVVFVKAFDGSVCPTLDLKSDPFA